MTKLSKNQNLIIQLGGFNILELKNRSFETRHQSPLSNNKNVGTTLSC